MGIVARKCEVGVLVTTSKEIQVLNDAFRNKALEEVVFYFNYTYTIGLGFCSGCPSIACGFAAWYVYTWSRNVSVQVRYSVAERKEFPVRLCVQGRVGTGTPVWISDASAAHT